MPSPVALASHVRGSKLHIGHTRLLPWRVPSSAQLMGYANRFGPGLVVYWGGYVDA